ncbi:hypothetical protein [Flavobacterium urumqiense]|uniref:Uncharacterized protein n=1 Tax=Flavobacterium urumqiense TaxID=935224 RepID=A0A1H5YY98_9FLAO|nr:hypothetical protein [Flavobacterium urumqiense]SEG29004.1 hypothetical protein SAMN04488130_1092 [Flavobacterium urumqiense]
MKSFLSLLLVSSLLSISCKKEVEPQNSATPTNMVPFTEVGKQMRNQSTIKSQAEQNSNVVNQNQATATPSPVAKGMNPAHGQPLHRCDIPVGQPLNSPVATAKNTPVTQQITSQQSQSAATNPTKATTAPIVTTPTAEGMNPPHGQTNHRCDITVGAPLPKS